VSSRSTLTHGTLIKLTDTAPWGYGVPLGKTSLDENLKRTVYDKLLPLSTAQAEKVKKVLRGKLQISASDALIPKIETKGR